MHGGEDALPKGARSAKTPGRKESCLLMRLGGEGPGLMGASSSISPANLLNSCGEVLYSDHGSLMEWVSQ